MMTAGRVKLFILRTSIAERLAYRADFAFATLVRFLPIVTQIFLWWAIYQSTKGGSGSLNGYTYADMVAYYLLVMLSRAFSSMPGLATGIARDIRDGTLKKFLIQPIDMLDYLFWHRVAHKLVYYVVAAGPFALVFWLCRSYFPAWPTPEIFAAGVVSLLLGFLVGFLLEAMLGLAGFWFLEVSSLVFVYMLLSYFLSGHMLPIDWLPPRVSEAIQWLPFKYLAFTPAAIFLGRYDNAQLIRELAIEAGWVAALFAANRWLLNRGLRRYSAFGG